MSRKRGMIDDFGGDAGGARCKRCWKNTTST